MTTYFTKEQIQQARQADLFDYLQANEPGVLKKDGRNYRHREHDSLVYVTAKNFWYWNSRGKSITALDYLMEIRGYRFSEAVSRLIGDAPHESFTASHIFPKRQQAKAAASGKAVSPVAEEVRDRIFQISAKTRNQREGDSTVPRAGFTLRGKIQAEEGREEDHSRLCVRRQGRIGQNKICLYERDLRASQERRLRQRQGVQLLLAAGETAQQSGRRL